MTEDIQRILAVHRLVPGGHLDFAISESNAELNVLEQALRQAGVAVKRIQFAAQTPALELKPFIDLLPTERSLILVEPVDERAVAQLAGFMESQSKRLLNTGHGFVICLSDANLTRFILLAQHTYSIKRAQHDVRGLQHA
jgi:hypothetical protein